MAEENPYEAFGYTEKEMEMLYAWGLVANIRSIESFTLAYMISIEFPDDDFPKRFFFFKILVEEFKKQNPSIMEKYEVLKNLVMEKFPSFKDIY